MNNKLNLVLIIMNVVSLVNENKTTKHRKLSNRAIDPKSM